ncbi:junctional adhesion molecule A [Hemicordylus capensis]|uniref:junctional adhesion molecule A n=1 Tax=Hemicordylus capensis TaxID=884348 RepID=UPI0023042A23|nr:junctional adhesion molecule A [Hemicordylus capensis]
MAGPAAAARSLLCVCLCAASWSLISGQNTVVQVPENSAATLPCQAAKTASTPNRLEWKFQKSGTTTVMLVYHEKQFSDDYRDRAIFYPYEIQLKAVTRKDNGTYTCEVLVGSKLQLSTVELVVEVPPSKPKAHVPSSVIIGNAAVLTCEETEGSPRPVFRWYKDGDLLPTDPKSSSKFKNSSYTLDPRTGVLTFDPATAFDAGDYYCEADNKIGSSQISDVARMQLSEVNVGGIVAAVVVLLIILGLVAFGVWFAYRRGYFRRKDTSSKKVIYSQPSNRSDGEFKQTSSFLV